MTNKTPTPGPWLIDQYAGFANPLSGHMIYAASGNGHLVCTLKHEYSDNQTANARLIAAAPELLEIARVVVKMGEGLKKVDFQEAQNAYDTAARIVEEMDRD